MDTSSSLLGRLPLGRSWQRSDLRSLLATLRTYLPDDQIQIVREAYEFGAEAHHGQKRMSGEPYISHPVAVASILADLHLDYQSICAAILHDVIEDTPTAKDQIVSKFGDEIADIVDGVSKLDQIKFKSQAEAQAESLRKMMLAMAKDIRVILLKLADRVHNMRTLDGLPPVKRRRIARETLDIYAPIANRLGINHMRLELEDLGFKALYPMRYRVIQRSIKTALGNRRQVMRQIASEFKKALAAAGVEGEIQSREKHVYSIYQKMRRKKLPLTEIADVYGFRIIVDEVDTCYRALGVVHSHYRPMPGRFKDHVAIPRVNGYQSLHTLLLGPKGVPLEIQIRTHDMERVANTGIAAHWLYKQGDSSLAPQERAREWLSTLVEMQADSDSEEFIESVKIDLFPDKVYVFTPRGDILRLPRGATAVDFAYAVHTGVGDRCVAVKVDRRRVPLRSQLRNGQTVDIITAKGAKPNPTWMNFVVTAKARTSIRTYLKKLRSNEARALGRKMMEKALAEFGKKPRSVPKDALNELLETLNIDSRDKLYEEIGLGQHFAPLIARRLLVGVVSDDHRTDAGNALTIAGTEGMVVSYARCCHPIPGDSVMAYLSSGRGIVIHRDDCGNLAEFRKQPDKWLTVNWEPGIDNEFTVGIRVEATDEIGVLAAVAATISDSRSNIEHVNVVERDGEVSALDFVIKVRNTEHLARVMKNIEKMPKINSVTRSTA